MIDIAKESTLKIHYLSKRKNSELENTKINKENNKK
jgi:hypothetical protein